MKLIIANWKSNKSLHEVTDWLDAFGQEVLGDRADGEKKAILCPAFPSVPLTLKALENHPHKQWLHLGVQDISSFPAGSYTGAVSAQNLKDLSVEYAIVGHSERRRYFHETHQDVANKIDQAIENNIQPIVCVDDEYILEQANAISKDNREKCIVAYEELSAIGTGNNLPVEDVLPKFDEIRKAFGDVLVVYGGSVKPENAAEYFDVCDGVLIGSASLKPDVFAQIIRVA